MPSKLIAARFEDTWTKLRVFELYKYGFERLVFLDADMLIRRNMDELFDLDIPRDWIAANHVCVCNLDHDSWAPEDWSQVNCAYTGSGVRSEPKVVPVLNQIHIPGGIRNSDAEKKTYTLLNSGMFVLSPHKEQWAGIVAFLEGNQRIKEYLFPDQDFLTDFFEGRWRNVGWTYNALKTMRYWHPEMWDDKEVRNVHYIVDKPWNQRVGNDGVAGYLGKDGVTHSWWWTEYEDWERLRLKRGRGDLVAMIDKEIAKDIQLN
jgi:inositol 3-alpha-galactosyltransferase